MRSSSASACSSSNVQSSGTVVSGLLAIGVPGKFANEVTDFLPIAATSLHHQFAHVATDAPPDEKLVVVQPSASLRTRAELVGDDRQHHGFHDADLGLAVVIIGGEGVAKYVGEFLEQLLQPLASEIDRSPADSCRVNARQLGMFLNLGGPLAAVQGDPSRLHDGIGAASRPK